MEEEDVFAFWPYNNFVNRFHNNRLLYSFTHAKIFLNTTQSSLTVRQHRDKTEYQTVWLDLANFSSSGNRQGASPAPAVGFPRLIPSTNPGRQNRPPNQGMPPPFPRSFGKSLLPCDNQSLLSKIWWCSPCQKQKRKFVMIFFPF